MIKDARQVIEQLLILHAHTVQTLARSDGVPFAVEEAVQQMVSKFGGRQPGVSELNSEFATRLTDQLVAVVAVRDRPEGLLFHVLLLQNEAYAAWPDPFRLSEFFQPDWMARGSLPTLIWSQEVWEARRVGDYEKLLRERDSVLLLGAVQAVVDGGRVLLCGADAQPELARMIWSLLPDATRAEVYAASLITNLELPFALAVLPTAPEPWPMGYLSAEQARDYPEGRYELALQSAIESGDQSELDRLLARRSSRQTLRLALMMLGFMIGGTLLVKWVL